MLALLRAALHLFRAHVALFLYSEAVCRVALANLHVRRPYARFSPMAIRATGWRQFSVMTVETTSPLCARNWWRVAVTWEQGGWCVDAQYETVDLQRIQEDVTR